VVEVQQQGLDVVGIKQQLLCADLTDPLLSCDRLEVATQETCRKLCTKSSKISFGQGVSDGRHSLLECALPLVQVAALLAY
jgi:hypothetical protein